MVNQRNHNNQDECIIEAMRLPIYEKKEVRIEDFVVRENKIFNVKKEADKEYEQEVGNLIWIRECRQNIEDNEVTLLMDYYYHGKKKTIEISRSQLQLNDFQKLISKGLDVGSHKARNVLRFLDYQEKKYAEYVYSHTGLGWDMYNDKLVYKHYEILGQKEINSHYNGKFDLEPKGSLAGWIQVVKDQILGHIPLEFAVALGFSSAVVALLARYKDMEVLVVHISGESSTGKTTMSKVVASTFGKPTTTIDKNEKEGLVQTWNGTQNAIINLLAGNHGVPIVLDEASMNQMGDFTNMIYQLAEGSEKARLTKDVQQRERRRWSGLVLSNAEHSLQKKSNQNSGLKVRLPEFPNVQWTRSGQQADEIQAGFEKNYGFAGQEFVKHLLTLDIGDILVRLDEWSRQCLDNMKEKDGFSYRIADKLAPILLTAELVNEVFPFELDVKGIMGLIIENDQKSVEDRDIGERAYNYFQQMVIQHRAKFEGEFFQQKATDCYGTLKKNGSKYEVAILREVFHKWMAEGGFQDESVVLQSFKAKKYLNHEKGKNTRDRQVLNVNRNENEEVDSNDVLSKREEVVYVVNLPEGLFVEKEEGTPPGSRKARSRKVAKKPNSIQSAKDLFLN